MNHKRIFAVVFLVFAIGCAPRVTILSPEDGDSFYEGEEIVFSSYADDFEDGELSGNALLWSSSVDGEIGRGASFATDNLTLGEHIITLTATDSDGNRESVEIAIEVKSSGEDGENAQEGQLPISVSGSLQNPAWSPDGNEILLTRFRNGYNEEPADLLIYSLKDGAVRTLVSDGSGNISLPGSSWNPITHEITFASSRDPHDEIFVIDAEGSPGEEIKITDRPGKVAYEPTFSPDGQWVVFESHILDVEGNGIITKYKVDGTGSYIELSGKNDDCRQPNWSPAGDLILYQKFSGGQWDVWVMGSDGTNHRKVTSGTGDKTDASFSPDGQWVVYSSDEGDLEFANLFIVPVTGGSSMRVTAGEKYDGAPSWSPDGTMIAYESSPQDPDGSEGTSLWIVLVKED